MKKILFSSFVFCFLSGCPIQTIKAQHLNFDFEEITKGLPAGWQTFGSSDYAFGIDSSASQHGKVCAFISYSGNSPGYKACSFSIPAKYSGKKITLTGYLKTENVSDGWAGLWMRIDPEVSFDNMQKRGVTGTTGWKKYSITLDLDPEKAQQIVVGGLLTGKGKLWIDNLRVTIDGMPLANAPEKKLLPADLDTSFDHGSGIEGIADADKGGLQTLGLVWGFLKYYHPNIASGNYNWDYELFRILPKYLAAKNHSERDHLLTEWIKSLGGFETDNKYDEAIKKAVMRPDLDWITKSGFSDELKNSLLEVRDAKRRSENYYVNLFPGVLNPEFKHEKMYGSMEYPDAGFRLLALFSYWNKIQYFFPYKNLIGKDWKDVLTEFIGPFINAKNTTEYSLAALKLIASIHDTHANLWRFPKEFNKFKGVNYAPVQVTFVEDKPVVTGYLGEVAGKATGLILGDEITAINNIPVAQIIKERLDYTPASNYPTQLRNIGDDLLRTNDSTMQLQYRRDGEIRTATIKTYAPALLNFSSKYSRNDTCFKILDGNIAYLYPGTIKNAWLPGIEKAMQDTKGLIIDMRCYPRDFIVFSFGQYLLPEKEPFVKFTSGSVTTPGLFTFGKPLYVGQTNSDYYKEKVVILVNEITQSQAEYTTMAFKTAPNVTVIGSTTAGADGNVSTIYLPGGLSTMISGIGVFYPDGTGTQRAGIVPDETVTPTIAGIKAGQDEVLERAIEIINRHHQEGQ